jgi:hypothetical protein
VGVKLGEAALADLSDAERGVSGALSGEWWRKCGQIREVE